jgi:type I restriction enzyme S subunit
VLSLSATTAGVFNPKFYKYLDEVIPEDSSAWLKRNDIIIQRGNTLEYVGIPAIYKGENNQFIYPDLMIRLSARKNILLPDFLYFFLSWEKIRNYMRDNASGTAGTMPKINQGVLKNLILSLPSLPEQHEIVRRVEKLFSLADSLEAKYKKVMGRVEKIEQAVLAKAFRGKLVEPDPNDEPAEELLKRILEEKAKIKPKNRKSSGKKK